MQIITLDISRYDVPETICAKQGDVGRKFQAKLTDSNKEYSIPEGARLSVWYSGTSGSGNYSAIGENSAFAVAGNTVTVEMITQMLQNKGGGTLCLMLHGTDGTQLGMWNIPYVVEPVPGLNSRGATDYYTALSETAAMAAASADKAQKAAAAAVNTLDNKLPVGLYTRWVNVDSTKNTGSAWEQLKAIFDDINIGTVVYCLLTISHGYSGEAYSDEPGGGNYMVEVVKNNGLDGGYGHIKLTSYWASPAGEFGNTRVYTNTCNAGKWLGMRYIHDMVPPKLLWVNPEESLTYPSSMGIQSITLDPWASKYDCLMILCRHSKNLPYVLPCFVYKYGGHHTACCYFPPAVAGSLRTDALISAHRYFLWQGNNGTTLRVSGGHYTAVGSATPVRNDGYAIPMRVYGVGL